MTHTALIVVDIQNDYFSGGKWELNAVDSAADNAARVIKGARDRGDLVIHVRHETLAPNAPFFVPDSHGAQLHDKVRAIDEEVVIVKHFMNPYRETQLSELLHRHGVHQVVVVGNMSHMCIDAVTRASVDFGFSAIVIHDACATHDLEFNNVKVPAALVHAAFMAALRFGYATVLSADEYLL
ncbi:isochorismatase family protein [Pseudomonas petrae]|uniref:Isochorismatase family protein n=1 Tax=Pseudomonas petrae TaxID=2912190 RepID=A0ABS9IB37_9PSED|nr:isochorismatase family protein [Pseudomonas petrae]MCF7530966.1 isochorismatase family protein [Pseudomonas petrae]MCF7536640.1 isochorismatase family protein [Pseudomonas petrae]MCF7544251.1 isochorismatase family protein [Pseudomonas petrae]MCF7554320.1 isochorismatase family protein [Pseudomonas petrae]